ncbi:MAG: hypothetical protein ACREQ5_06785 [Candidatus Dormibacteria bacterium]
MFKKAINNDNTTAILWWVTGCSAVLYIHLTTGGWAFAFLIFAMYLIGTGLLAAQYNRGMTKATQIHNDAMMAALSKYQNTEESVL